eukprot:GDKI01015826.1.p1 GENE.GDKI01015826.1~~GDKI01015826.1.p1  ORF type:complete len:289 (-),score=80.12 GDKI01015826.1:41-907(-)
MRISAVICALGLLSLTHDVSAFTCPQPLYVHTTTQEEREPCKQQCLNATSVKSNLLCTAYGYDVKTGKCKLLTTATPMEVDSAALQLQCATVMADTTTETPSIATDNSNTHTQVADMPVIVTTEVPAQLQTVAETVQADTTHTTTTHKAAVGALELHVDLSGDWVSTKTGATFVLSRLDADVSKYIDIEGRMYQIGAGGLLYTRADGTHAHATVDMYAKAGKDKVTFYSKEGKEEENWLRVDGRLSLVVPNSHTGGSGSSVLVQMGVKKNTSGGGMSSSDGEKHYRLG